MRSEGSKAARAHVAADVAPACVDLSGGTGSRPMDQFDAGGDDDSSEEDAECEKRKATSTISLINSLRSVPNLPMTSPDNSSLTSASTLASLQPGECGTTISSSASGSTGSFAPFQLSSRGQIVEVGLSGLKLRRVVGTSWVWEHCRAYVDDSKKQFAWCTLCKGDVNYGTNRSTSKVEDHIRVYHPVVMQEHREAEAAAKAVAAGIGKKQRDI